MASLIGVFLSGVVSNHLLQQLGVLELEVECGITKSQDLWELLAGWPVPVPETRHVDTVDPLTLHTGSHTVKLSFRFLKPSHHCTDTGEFSSVLHHPALCSFELSSLSYLSQPAGPNSTNMIYTPLLGKLKLFNS